MHGLDSLPLLFWSSDTPSDGMSELTVLRTDSLVTAVACITVKDTTELWKPQSPNLSRGLEDQLAYDLPVFLFQIIVTSCHSYWIPVSHPQLWKSHLWWALFLFHHQGLSHQDTKEGGPSFFELGTTGPPWESIITLVS